MAHLTASEPLASVLRRALGALDSFFLSEALRSRSATELAYARLGVIGCIAMGIAALAFVPWQIVHWPLPMLLYMIGSALLCIVLPLVLRRQDAIRHVGHLACAQISLYAAAAVVLSGGRATGVLPVLPMIPMLALLMRGGRAVMGWGLVTLGIAVLGAVLTRFDVPPPLATFRELSHFERYPITVLCVVIVLGVSLLFETLWHQSALEVAARLQADLAVREDRYRTLLEHASEGIIVVGSDRRIRFASPAAERLIGVPPGAAIGRPLRDFGDGSVHAEALPAWNVALAHPGERASVELVRGMSGQAGAPLPRRIEVSITNQLDHPAVRGVVIHLHDASALARAQTNYRNLVEQSLQGIVVVREFRIVYANRAVADLFGTDIDHFVGRHVNELLSDVHPEDRARVVEALSRSGGGPENFLEMRLFRPDGAMRWVQIRWSDAVSEGLTARQIAYVDVTAQKELDASRLLEQERLEARIAEQTRELEASQQTLRAQERLAAVGTLAAGVAHQINNPVGAILAASEFAIVAEDDSDRVDVAARALREIRDQAVRCGRIIRSILQFSRTQSTNKRPGRAVDVLRSAVDATRRIAGEHGATVELSIRPDASDLLVSMSPIELEQVFVNLVLNAIQAQSAGAHVWLDLRSAGSEIEIRVEDDGPGISPADRGRIFDPFFTTRLKGGGTGLGLSVAHSILEDHGGRIELVPPTRRVDGGTCFRVLLPRLVEYDSAAAARTNAT